MNWTEEKERKTESRHLESNKNMQIKTRFFNLKTFSIYANIYPKKKILCLLHNY